MSANLIEFVERMFVGPVWPASVLVCLLSLYTLIALFGLIDLDFGLGGETDVDLGGDLDAGGFDAELGGESLEPHSDLLGGAGAATLRWMNLGRVPLIVWAAVFTVVFWAISYGLWYGFDTFRYQPTLVTSVLLVLRNGVIAIGTTKLLTNPLKRVFEPPPSYGPSNLIGQRCVVVSGQVTTDFGQAKFSTDAAPLLLNVCTDGECIPRGSSVEIVAFDADRRVYKVTNVPDEVAS